MKILFLNIYQSQVERGAETFVREISKRLSDSHKVDVVSSDIHIPARWPVYWRTFMDPQGILIGTFTLKQIGRIIRERYDVIVPVNGGWQVAIVRFITWLYGGKMVVSGQAGMGWDDRNNLWAFPNVFVALSTKAMNWAKKYNPFIRVKYIPNGVDTKKFTPKGKIYVHNLQPPIVLCVSALTKTKRVELTIEAVSKMGNASLLLVGDGELKGDLKKMGKRMLGKRFKQAKFPHNRMPEVYRSADVFTIASESYYAFEIVLAEAMSTGLAVVANDDEIRAEIVGNTGVLVNPTDIDAYAKAIAKTIKQKNNKRSRNMMKKFDWDKIAEQYEELFKEVCK